MLPIITALSEMMTTAVDDCNSADEIGKSGSTIKSGTMNEDFCNEIGEITEADNNEEQYYESLPDAVDSTSVKTDDDESSVEEDEDGFDMEAIPMPRLSSSTVPVKIEVVLPRSSSGQYTSEDPLFQGICLYTSTSSLTPSQPKSSATVESKVVEEARAESLHDRWFFPSIFQYLLSIQRR